jgi:hypothetical protein
MKNIAFASYASTTSTLTPYTDIGPIFGGSTYFSLARQTNILAVAMLYGVTSGAVGTYSRYALRIGDQQQGTTWGSATIIAKTETDWINGTLFYFASLPPGRWDAGIQCGVDSGRTATTGAAMLALFSLGA